MNSIKLHGQLLVLVAMILVLADRVVVAEDSPDVAKRIAAVENGLLPSVRIKGRTIGGKIAERMAHHHVPGVSVAVINDYRIEWAKGYGLADTEAGTPVTTDTLFQAGSVSKPVAAMAAVKLVQDGLLDLDRNVNDQLKSWKVPDNKYTAEHAVDLRGLLSHTAGMTVHGFPGYKVDEPLPSLPDILDGKSPANTAPVRVNKAPGSGFRYAGGGTTVMQQLVIDVTGRPFSEVVRELVLEPLGMAASSYEQPLDEQSQTRAASAHRADGKPIAGRWHVYPEMAAAGLWTTASDVARYVIELQLGHEDKSAKVLKHEMIEQVLTPQGGGPVGLGPFLHHEGQRHEFSHGGRNDGFTCQFVGLLDRGQGVVVMTNSDNGNRVVDEVTNAIAEVYGWPEYLSPAREALTLDEKTLDSFTGKYKQPVGTFNLTRDGQRLVAKAPVGGELEFYFDTPTTFFTDQPSVKGRFVADEQGQVTEIVLTQGGREMHVKRVKE